MIPGCAWGRIDSSQTVRNGTPSHRRSRTLQPATQWKSATSVRRGSSSRALSGSSNGVVTAPRTSMAGSGGTTGSGLAKWTPKRGNVSTSPWPGWEAAGAARPEIADVTEH